MTHGATGRVSARPYLPSGVCAGVCLLAALVLGGCATGTVRDGQADAPAPAPSPGEWRCEVTERHADIGTTRTTRCLLDADGNGTDDVLETTTELPGASGGGCQRFTRAGGGWARAAGACVHRPAR